MVSNRIQVIKWQNSDTEGLNHSNLTHKLHMTTKKERGVKFKMKEIFISPKVCKDNSSIIDNAF